jgi:hypothetical protein
MHRNAGALASALATLSTAPHVMTLAEWLDACPVHLPDVLRLGIEAMLGKGAAHQSNAGAFSGEGGTDDTPDTGKGRRLRRTGNGKGGDKVRGTDKPKA